MDAAGPEDVTKIRFIDPQQDDDWPKSTPLGVKRYLTSVVRLTPAGLMENAQGVEARILRVGDAILPIMVSDGAGGKASILSPFAHHVSYPIEEISKNSRFLTPRRLGVILSPLTLLLKSGSLDRAVFLNHWLLSGAPEPDVPPDAWRAVIAFVAAQYPSHAIVVQDIKPSLNAAAKEVLEDAGGLFVPTRLVSIVDPNAALHGPKNKRKRKAQNLALKLYKDTRDELLPEQVVQEQVGRICALYRLSNVARHSNLNPLYTEAFFELALTCEEFRLQAWHAEDERQVAAFNLQRLDDRFIHWSTFGAENRRRVEGAERHSMYERVVATDLFAAKQTGLLLDWGGGASDFKRFRGGVLHPQYEVVFARHLSPWRRLVWAVLARLRNIRQRQVHSKDSTD